jgi:ankyrin repeat protein
MKDFDLGIERQFFDLCKEGCCIGIEKILKKHPDLLHHKSNEGWSAIIVASFWQRYKLVNFLIKCGANVNDVGKSGTSVLMYAKTKLLGYKNPNLSLLELLINAGAETNRKDNFGNDIFYYLNKKNSSDKIIESYLKSF